MKTNTAIVDTETHLPHEVAELICLKCFKRQIHVYPIITPLKKLKCECGEVGYLIKTGQTLFEGEDEESEETDV